MRVKGGLGYGVFLDTGDFDEYGAAGFEVHRVGGEGSKLRSVCLKGSVVRAGATQVPNTHFVWSGVEARKLQRMAGIEPSWILWGSHLQWKSSNTNATAGATRSSASVRTAAQPFAPHGMNLPRGVGGQRILRRGSGRPLM